MRIRIVDGTVSNDTTLPRFTDVYPSFVAPTKILTSDGFTINRATLNSGATDYGGLTWSAGTGFDVVDDAEGGYVTRAAASTGSQFIDIGETDFKVYCAIKWSASPTGFAGIVGRLADTSNYWRLAISSLGVLQLAKQVAGSFTTVDTSTVSPSANDVCLIALQGVGNDLVGFYNHVEHVGVTDAALAANEMVGITGNDTGHKFLEFVAGTV